MRNFQSLPEKDWVVDCCFRRILTADPGAMKFAG